MSGVSTSLEREPRRAWFVAFILTSLVSLAGFVVAMQQCTVKYVLDNWAHTRTLPGVLFVLLGVVGMGLPVLLIRRRKRFASHRASRQWLLAIGIPLIYVAAFVLCIEASLRSTTMILPRADTPQALVGYKNGRVHIDFRCRRGFPGIGGSDQTDRDDAVEPFSAEYEAAYSPRNCYLTSVVVRGQTRRRENGMLQIDLDVDADEPITFAVEGLEVRKMTCDGQPINESYSLSGKFHVTILAQHTATTVLTARFAQAATHVAKVEVLREIVALGPKTAAKILEQIALQQPLLAIDDQSHCVFHDNESRVVHWVSHGKCSGSSATGEMQLDDVRWLGWFAGDAFGFPSQRYSVFAGQQAGSDDYAIVFLAFEDGKGAGINAGELREDHYHTLSRFGKWPDDWPHKSEIRHVENDE